MLLIVFFICWFIIILLNSILYQLMYHVLPLPTTMIIWPNYNCATGCHITGNMELLVCYLTFYFMLWPRTKWQVQVQHYSYDLSNPLLIIIIIIYELYIALYITCKKLTVRRLITNNSYGCNRFTSLKIDNSFQPNI